MNHRLFSGILWILLAIFMIVEGIVEVVKSGHQEAWIYVGLGVLIIVFQGWLYKRTGSIGGPL
ncbi:hypothetical protein [Thermosulfidibacter takaii]|uniref:hypothetical protein n=1 Tax=Thermosulfidibacter takaii TaxID=412593 RepID=UPI00083947B3|nr:hypothetical protein [Thermosulfidibacter takaii]